MRCSEVFSMNEFTNEKTPENKLRDMLKDMRLEVNRGKNRFTMSHGSFNYRRRRGIWKKLRCAGTAETEKGFDLLFADGGKTFALSVFREDTEVSGDTAGEAYGVRLIVPGVPERTCSGSPSPPRKACTSTAAARSTPPLISRGARSASS